MAEEQEKLEKWLGAVKRCSLAAKTLEASIKLMQEGGPTQEIAFDVVKEAREAFGVAKRHEATAWKAMGGPADQQSMDLDGKGAKPVPEEPQGPQGIVGRPQRGLPPHEEKTDGEAEAEAT